MSNGSFMGMADKPARHDLHGKVIDVHIDASAPLNSYLTIKAESESNFGRYAGTYNVSLDNSMSSEDRYRVAREAKQNGGGFSGALINEYAQKVKNRYVIMENFVLIGEHVGTARWLKSSSNNIHRRPGIIDTHIRSIEGKDRIPGKKYIRTTSLTVFNHNSFDVNDTEALGKMMERADKHYTMCTKPRDYMVKMPNQDGNENLFLRSSMPRTNLALIVVNAANNEVQEYTTFFDRRKNVKPTDFPSHFTDKDVKEFSGPYSGLPYNSESIARLINSFQKYTLEHYKDQEVKVLVTEAIRYIASWSATGDRDMTCDRPVDDMPVNPSFLKPIEAIHQANKTTYSVSKRSTHENSSVQTGAYIENVTWEHSKNQGNTFNRFITTRPSYPSKNIPWITKIMHKGQSLLVPLELQIPRKNAAPMIEHEITSEEQSVAMQPTSPDKESSYENCSNPISQASITENEVDTSNIAHSLDQLKTSPKSCPKTKKSQHLMKGSNIDHVLLPELTAKNSANKDDSSNNPLDVSSLYFGPENCPFSR